MAEIANDDGHSITKSVTPIAVPQLWHAYQQIAPLSKAFVYNLIDLCLILLVSYSVVMNAIPIAHDPSRWIQSLDYKLIASSPVLFKILLPCIYSLHKVGPLLFSRNTFQPFVFNS